MKKLSAEQIQNIVFTAIIALAVTAIYLLIGRGQGAPALFAAQTPAPTQAPAPSETAAGFERVPEAILLEQLAANDAFSAEKTRGKAHSLELLCGESVSGGATVSYTLDDGDVSSLTFLFQTRERPYYKTKDPIEQRVLAEFDAYLAAQNTALQTMLPACISACDLNNVLIEPVLYSWYSGALAARDEQKTFRDTFLACEFTAYPSQIGARQVVICSLLMP